MKRKSAPSKRSTIRRAMGTPPPGLTRRKFLQRTALISFASWSITACADDEDSPGMADAGSATDGAQDTGSSADAAVDAGGTGPDTGENWEDAGPTFESEVVTKGPWIHVTGPTSALLVFETAGVPAMSVVFNDASQERTIDQLRADTREMLFEWPAVITVDHPDEPGEYTVYRAELVDLEPGATYSWQVRDPDGGTVSGSFKTPPPPGTAFRFAWLADTMQPAVRDVAALIEEAEPDFVIHGGDLQYQSSPLDTWNGFFDTFKNLMRTGPMHITVGNHEYDEYIQFAATDEYEGQYEYEQQYIRLFGQQGEPGGSVDYHAFTWGSVRFIILNSEEGFGVDGTPQMQWLVAELEALADNDDILQIVVCFHRPYYTFSRSRSNVTHRNFVDPLIRAAGAKLVLAGHNHVYERFEVDGMFYIVDGGGGALLYNPDSTLSIVEEGRPEEVPLRILAERSFGTCIFDVAEDGTIRCVRRSTLGQTTDSFEIPVG